MRFVILVCGSCVALLAMVTMASGAPADFVVPDPKPHYNLDESQALFEKFIKDFDRNYKDDADKQVHYEAFVKSLQTINQLNSDPNQTAWFDINNFADFTEEQRKQMFGLRPIE